MDVLHVVLGRSVVFASGGAGRDLALLRPTLESLKLERLNLEVLKLGTPGACPARRRTLANNLTPRGPAPLHTLLRHRPLFTVTAKLPARSDRHAILALCVMRCAHRHRPASRLIIGIRSHCQRPRARTSQKLRLPSSTRLRVIWRHSWPW
ncbi:hypothetical protein HYPSUDRAFT_817651 [Hypholoma sublateritium FD-334 SS-4]|uniref:Uncharacterized protein n=1 Tax=Hypholoma sublateritium (strain FD-334 SS-4) TaxID=945553 RepID=A0A0D2MAG5_HYPSF|nr:hypothetical protein HYPSUDRAFT_817651 [Hypholoma sublateritium FD-334 SS-4]